MVSHEKIILVLIVLQSTGSFQLAPEESILLKKLLAGHSNDIRPLPKHLTGPTVVNITVRIIQVLDIDERNEVLSMLTWVTMQWEDSTFTWDPGANSNIRYVLFPAANIWVPDVIIQNTQEISSGFHLGLPQNTDDAPFLAKAVANGSVSLGFPHIIKSSCKLNISEYPFDMQHCPVTLGSWSHDKSEMIINIKSNEFFQETRYGKQNKAWQLTSTDCKATDRECPFNETSMKCNVVQCFIGLKRTAWFEVISYTLPTIVIAVLSIMVFMVPPEAGKRMEVGITLILCIAVYLSLINKKMPPTSESFPLVSKFYGCIIVEITIAMVCSCYCLHIYDPEGLRLLHFPNYLRTLAFGVLARITFYQTKGGKPSRIHPTNAEIKIIERRRKSMIAMNSGLQLNAAGNGARTFSVKPAENRHFGLKPEAVNQPLATQQLQINQIVAINNSQRSADNEELDEEPQPDLQLADIEEEREEDLIEPQANPGNGENRCDSGFGEPGGSLSNRSSLLSSASVRLPVETNSPANEASCECGQQGCDGHGDISNNSLENQPNQEAEPEPVTDPSQSDENKKDIPEPMSNKPEVKFLRRSKTTVIGNMDATGVQGNLLPKTLSARPYTDSVLSVWKRRKYAKAFQSSLRSKASLVDFEVENSGRTAESNRSKLVHKEEGDGKALQRNEAGEGSKEKTPEENSSSNDESFVVVAEKSGTAERGNIVASRKNSQVSLNNNVSGPSTEAGTSEQGRKEEDISKQEEDNTSVSKEGRAMQASRPPLDKKQSYDQIELIDINDDEEGQNNEDIEHTAETAVTELNGEQVKPSEEASAFVINNENGETGSTKEENSAGIDTAKNEEAENESVDGETENDEKEPATPRTRKKTVDDNKVLFTRRHWDTLRNRVQRRITVKEVFGQILSPKETSPIVAIANVLLRDQRKYVMRTEWMTSAMIFNRFFIILLTLAVIISLLAVFLQSSRLRNL